MMDNKDFKAKLLEYCKNKGILVTNKMTVDTIMSRITEFENNSKKLTETSIFTTDDTTQDNSLEAQAKRLIRCKITCYNPDKNRLGGEIISVGNAVIPEQRKFIAYDKPYHISQLMYNVLKEKTFTRYKRIDTKDKKTTETYQAKEYSIEILPPLTSEEFEAIRQRQILDNRDNNDED